MVKDKTVFQTLYEGGCIPRCTISWAYPTTFTFKGPTTVLAAVAMLLQAPSVPSSGTAGYAFTVGGILLSTGAVAWFFRSGVDVIRAKEKSVESLALGASNTERIVTLETRMERKDADSATMLAQLAAVSARIELMATQHNSELRSLEAQFSRVEGTLTEIRRGLANLDQVGQVIESVKNTKEQLQKVQQLLEQNHVPRREMEARFMALEQRIDKGNEKPHHD